MPGGVSEWLKETGCKPVGSAYAGSNPAPTMFFCTKSRAFADNRLEILCL